MSNSVNKIPPAPKGGNMFPRFLQTLMAILRKPAINVLGLLEVTAPDTDDEAAVIYVDEADGDLKVKFKNGTVKTIETN